MRKSNFLNVPRSKIFWKDHPFFGHFGLEMLSKGLPEMEFWTNREFKNQRHRKQIRNHFPRLHFLPKPSVLPKMVYVGYYYKVNFFLYPCFQQESSSLYNCADMMFLLTVSRKSIRYLSLLPISGCCKRLSHCCLIVDTTLDDWNLIMATNVTGAFLHTREALKAMIPNKKGAIVNIDSYACFFTFPLISAYAALKVHLHN